MTTGAIRFQVPDSHSEADLQRQAWRYHLVLIAWPLYLMVAPGVIHACGPWGLLLIAVPGAFLFNCLCLLHHESWHRYVPGFPNQVFFHVSGWMLFCDPQLFRLIHGHHHTRVSSWRDVEVHPFGYIESRGLRILNNTLEIVVGMLYILLGWYINVPRHPLYRRRFRLSKLALSVCAWLVIGGMIGLVSHHVFRATALDITLSWLFTFWLGGLLLHHSTLIQHGNLIVQGDLHERNRWVRSLRPKGWAEKAFLIVTQQDQALHHWNPGTYYRVFRNNRRDIPSGAVLIDLSDFLGLLGELLRGVDTDHRALGGRTPRAADSRVKGFAA